eukprot:CAMPEP_0174242164 /NCGR_PEP_ID=MMETSP0417-20130205/26647_1 /TAXON_ID=242541 /ORGANISM="Mayorella sp, Strain BSH-02190019" /LENGTH=158 /DNA_ID=CAMNT_0015321523 /DNA_START=51 /DNA_END=523 /DNA_ORIENTATION=+
MLVKVRFFATAVLLFDVWARARAVPSVVFTGSESLAQVVVASFGEAGGSNGDAWLGRLHCAAAVDETEAGALALLAGDPMGAKDVAVTGAVLPVPGENMAMRLVGVEWLQRSPGWRARDGVLADGVRSKRALLGVRGGSTSPEVTAAISALMPSGRRT